MLHNSPLELETLKHQLVDITLRAFAYCLFIPLSASLFRIVDTGWQPVMGIHILVTVLTAVISTFRAEVSYKIKASYLALMFYTLGLSSLYTYGLIGLGTVFLIVSMIFFTLFFGLHTGIVSATSCVLAISGIGIFTSSGMITYDLNFEQYAYASSSWIATLATFVFVAVIAVISIGTLQAGLSKNVTTLQNRSRDLEETNETLSKLSTTDELTGMMNRRCFFEHVTTEFERFQRYQHPMVVLYIDIDHFKEINDTHGHEVGDKVLQDFSAILSKACRRQDLVGRIGGEEFSALLVETQLAEAQLVAERINEACRTGHITHTDHEIKYTVSIGLSYASHHDPSFESVLNRADQAMYLAKSQGKNRYAISEKSMAAM